MRKANKWVRKFDLGEKKEGKKYAKPRREGGDWIFTTSPLSLSLSLEGIIFFIRYSPEINLEFLNRF